MNNTNEALHHVINTTVYHLLLRRAWKFHYETYFLGTNSTYTFVKNHHKAVSNQLLEDTPPREGNMEVRTLDVQEHFSSLTENEGVLVKPKKKESNNYSCITPIPGQVQELINEHAKIEEILKTLTNMKHVHNHSNLIHVSCLQDLPHACIT